MCDQFPYLFIKISMMISLKHCNVPSLNNTLSRSEDLDNSNSTNYKFLLLEFCFLFKV